MTKNPNIIVAMLAVAALTAGCATKQQTGALAGAVVGAAVLGPIGGVAAAHIAAGAAGLVVGGIVGGEIGKHLDARDRMHVETSMKKSSTETWTSSSGAPMTATTKDVTPEKKEVTVTSGDQTEKSTMVKKQNKWVKE
jgi:outer membrane lipoprotein SlyB